jgi:hypothetical protein
MTFELVLTLNLIACIHNSMSGSRRILFDTWHVTEFIACFSNIKCGIFNNERREVALSAVW